MLLPGRTPAGRLPLPRFETGDTGSHLPPFRAALLLRRPSGRPGSPSSASARGPSASSGESRRPSGGVARADCPVVVPALSLLFVPLSRSLSNLAERSPGLPGRWDWHAVQLAVALIGPAAAAGAALLVERDRAITSEARRGRWIPDSFIPDSLRGVRIGSRPSAAGLEIRCGHSPGRARAGVKGDSSSSARAARIERTLSRRAFPRLVLRPSA